MILDSVSGKISPSFGYMTTYVELLVRYAELMKIKLLKGFLVLVKFLPFTKDMFIFLIWVI